MKISEPNLYIFSKLYKLYLKHFKTPKIMDIIEENFLIYLDDIKNY